MGVTVGVHGHPGSQDTQQVHHEAGPGQEGLELSIILKVPDFIMSAVLIVLAPKTMAFGAVATGSMKA